MMSARISQIKHSLHLVFLQTEHRVVFYWAPLVTALDTSN